MSWEFALKAPVAELGALAAKYRDPREDRLENVAAPAFRERGFLTREDLLELCEWKSSRRMDLARRNSAAIIKDVTRIALGTPHERLRIHVLTALEGVGWPIASVILHFGYEDIYPVLDFRALWSLGVEAEVTYNFDFWQAYTAFCRELARDCGLSMRNLDRALWQYSKDNQG